MIGDKEGLAFDLVWESPAPAQDDRASDCTRGKAIAYVGNQVIWGKATPDPRGLDWTWVELVEHLARSWNRLRWEEGDPFGFNEVSLGHLRLKAEDRWAGLSSEVREREEQILWAFEEAHNLAAGLQGMAVPPIWVIRQGALAYVSARGMMIWVSIDSVLGVLSQLGDAIVARLTNCQDERSKVAVEAWKNRERMTPGEFVLISTGLQERDLASLVGSRRNEDLFWGFHKGRIEENEIVATARMARGGLVTQELGKLLDRIRKMPRRGTEKLDRQTDELRTPLRRQTFGHPFEEGYYLAKEMREWLGNPGRHVDPEGVLRNWNVLIQRVQLPASRQLDAICCWGPNHGPAVIVNEAGTHARSSGGQRATLAHEICHLILDRPDALPLGEVLGGRVAEPVEVRARAFAAEFLLPRALVTEEWNEKDAPDELVQRLARRFDVSQQIVAWQVRNSGVRISQNQYLYLKSLVDEPHRF